MISDEYQLGYDTATAEVTRRVQSEMAVLRSELAEAKRALPLERDWLTIRDEWNRLEEGYKPILAYTDGCEVVVCGDPPDEDTDPEGSMHNCDDMGCTSVSHVIARIILPWGKEKVAHDHRHVETNADHGRVAEPNRIQSPGISSMEIEKV